MIFAWQVKIISKFSPRLRQQAGCFFPIKPERIVPILSRSPAVGHLLALAVSIVWGTTYISTKVLLDAFHPVEILIFRFVLAWAILFLCVPKPHLPRSFRSELPFLGAALSGLTFYSLLENYALTFSMASTVGLIVSSAPMFTAPLLWLCRRTTRPGASFFVGFVLAMAGIALISLAEGESFDFNPIGCLLALGSAISWGVYGLCLESAQRQGLNDLLVTRKVFFWGVLFTLPFCLGTGITFDLTRFAQPVMLGNTVYLGVVASALCFLAWNRASALIGPVATNVYLYLMPVITVAASFLILGEPVTLFTLGAIVLILAGLWLSQRRSTTLTT